MRSKPIVTLLCAVFSLFATAPAFAATYSFNALSYSGNFQRGGQLKVVARLTSSAAINTNSVCVVFASPSQYAFNVCKPVALQAGANTVNLTLTIPATAEIATYSGAITVANNNPWTTLATSSTLATLTLVQTSPAVFFTFSSLNYSGAPKPNGQINVTANVSASAATTAYSVCANFVATNQFNISGCKAVTLAAGPNAINYTLTIPATAPLGAYSGFITVARNNPWADVAKSPKLTTLTVSTNPPISPPPLTGNGAALVWQQDFSTTPLTLRTAANPNAGVWMPNDMTWQSPVQGYVDFAAMPCAAADVASGVCTRAGGTFDINPNDPNMQGVTPFSQADGYLTISVRPTPSNLVSVIQAEMNSQGVYSLVPSFIGGHLQTNPAVFPGFTYGYFEFRVAFPNGGPSMFPALWFYSTPGKNPTRPHAEIDLLEYFGATSSFSTTMYTGVSGNNVGTTIGQHVGVIDGVFHTYGMDWTADHIDFYFDYQKMYSAPASLVTAYQGVSLSPLMNYVADSSWMEANQYLRWNATTPNPLKMNVNYVRLYNKKPF